MRKIFTICMLMAACLMTTNLYATYYIAGNGDSSKRGSWCGGFNWSSNGVALTNDEVTYENLPAEWYVFKITEGSWNPQWGYSDVDAAASSPMYKDGDGNNIGFRLQAPADVTIKMVNNKVVLLIDREYCITGNGGEVGDGAWLAGHNWWAKNDDAKLDANLSRTYYNLPAGTYKFKVKENVDNAWNGDCTWGYDHLDNENSNVGEADGDNNIQFTLGRPGDVTIAMVNNSIRVNASAVFFITGNGSEERGTWCNQKSWSVKDAESRLDPTTLSKTYTNLPAGTYQFKISNGAWQDQGGTIWNHDNADFETSSFGYYSADGDNKNIAFKLTEAADVTIQFDPATGKISLTSSKGYFDATYYIVGTSTLIPTGWDAGASTFALTNMGDNTFQYVQEDQELEAGTYDYKIVADRKWDTGSAYPNGNGNNAQVVISTNGIYTLTYTFVPATKTVNCTPVLKPVTPTAIDNVNLKNNGKYYDVLGREITNPQKGNLYIHNGKKVLF